VGIQGFCLKKFIKKGLNILLSKPSYIRELLKFKVSRLAVFEKPQFTLVNEDFAKTA